MKRNLWGGMNQHFFWENPSMVNPQFPQRDVSVGLFCVKSSCHQESALQVGVEFSQVEFENPWTPECVVLGFEDQNPSPPFSLGRSKVALATLDMVPFQIKLVTSLSSLSSVFFHLGMSPAWYQMMERHMVLATMALSTGEEDSLESSPTCQVGSGPWLSYLRKLW